MAGNVGRRKEEGITSLRFPRNRASILHGRLLLERDRDSWEGRRGGKLKKTIQTRLAASSCRGRRERGGTEDDKEGTEQGEEGRR
jgi:hypothetical protein